MTGRLTRSLAALAQNYRTLSTATEAQVAGVVKANAYGVGIDIVIPQLIAEGCEIFFVATITEGMRVRVLLNEDLAQTPNNPIYVLSGVTSQGEAKACQEFDLRPVINNDHQLNLWDTKKPHAIHIDTGMERLGFDFADGLALLNRLRQTNAPNLILSHFARADEGDNPYMQTQLDRVARLRNFDLPISISNSAGLLLHELKEDVARAGIALYGGSPSGDAQDCLHPVARLEGQVLQIREVRKGTPVGYGGTYVPDEDATIATIGVGYADGVSRLLSNKGQVWAGKYLPIVGRVSMDMLHVKCDGVDLSPGDYVEVVGSHVNVEDVAKNAQTLSYEVLTGLDAARRLERVTTGSLL